MSDGKRVQVAWDELESAFDFVSSAPQYENEASISAATGKISWSGPYIDEDEEEECDESEGVIGVPHKNALDLGRALAMRFAERELPDDYEQVDDIFRRRGAYGRFKNFLAGRGKLERWYEFEASETQRALLEWCERNDIDVVGAPALKD